MRSLQLVLLIVVLSVAIIFAQSEKIQLWPGLAPGSENVANQEQWQDSSKVFNVYQPDLTVFMPKSVTGPLPAIMVCPGGGYRQLEIVKEGTKVARWLAKHGIAAFVLKYRLDPEMALQDVQQAMLVLRDKAKELNIDPDKIGVMGFSAGAHLSGNLAMHYRITDELGIVDSTSIKPDFWIGVYGNYRPRAGNRSEYFRTFTPYSDLVHEQSPPVLLVHAGDDSRVPVISSVDLYRAYHKAGAPAELLVYERGEHGFALETDRGPAVTATVESWSQRLLAWLALRGVFSTNSE